MERFFLQGCLLFDHKSLVALCDQTDSIENAGSVGLQKSYLLTSFRCLRVSSEDVVIIVFRSQKQVSDGSVMLCILG